MKIVPCSKSNGTMINYFAYIKMEEPFLSLDSQKMNGFQNGFLPDIFIIPRNNQQEIHLTFALFLKKSKTAIRM